MQHAARQTNTTTGVTSPTDPPSSTGTASDSGAITGPTDTNPPSSPTPLTSTNSLTDSSPSSLTGSTTSGNGPSTNTPSSSASVSTISSAIPTSSQPSTLASASTTSGPTASASSTSVPPASSTSTTSTPDLPPSTSSESSPSTPSDPSSSSQVDPNESVNRAHSFTTSFSTIVTSVNGQLTTFTSALPTSLSEAPNSTSQNSNRTAVIAGSTIAGAVALLLVLASLFLYKRHKLRHAVAPKVAVRRPLLDGEGFDEQEGVALARYRDVSRNSMTTSMSSSPSLFRPRMSGSGTMFREEVWPPPVQAPTFEDPITHNVQRSREVSLGTIVGDVMGSPLAEGSRPGHTRNQSSESMYSDDPHYHDSSGSYSKYSPLGGGPPSILDTSSQISPQSPPGIRPTEIPEAQLAPPKRAQSKKPSPLGRAV